MNLQMLLMGQAGQFERKRMYTEWQKPTKLLLIIDGKIWHTKKIFYIKHVISGLLPILMLGRRPRQKGFYTTLDVCIKLAKFMKERPRWIGWFKSKNGELRLLLQPPVVIGQTIILILLIRLDTLILQLK